MTPEGKIAHYLKTRIEQCGGLIRKIVYEGRRDCPDYVVHLCGQTYFIETKAPGETPRDSQLYEFAQIAIHGEHPVIVVDSKESVDMCINQLLHK